jgi:hypothetical protein
MMNASHLLTAELQAKLRSNAASRGEDQLPLAKLFNPVGAGTWIVTELADDEDTLFGIADLGFGSPEVGSFSLAELESLRLPFGLRIERDIAFSTEHRLSAWAEAARASGSLATAERILAAAARRESSS